MAVALRSPLAGRPGAHSCRAHRMPGVASATLGLPVSLLLESRVGGSEVGV